MLNMPTSTGMTNYLSIIYHTTSTSLLVSSNHMVRVYHTYEYYILVYSGQTCTIGHGNINNDDANQSVYKSTITNAYQQSSGRDDDYCLSCMAIMRNG